MLSAVCTEKGMIMKKIVRIIKKIIKKVLIKLGLIKQNTVYNQPAKKITPDFDITTRNMPEYILKSGEIHEELMDFENPKIAIQVHAFFIEVMDEVADILNSIPYPFDCYISTDTYEKKEKICKLLEKKCEIHFLQVDMMDNRGRDVGPFIEQLGPVISKYKYIAHLHTKKSKHTDFGDDWRHFLYRNMFGGKECILTILDWFEKDEKLGLIVPEVYPIVRELMAWDNTKEDVKKLLETMGLSAELPDVPICPVGDIFWARTDAVKILFEQGIKQTDFQEEAGQLNYTLEHVIERIWCYLVQAQGYTYKVCINGVESAEEANVKRALVYACDDAMTEIDYAQLKKLSANFDYTLVGVLDENEKIRAGESAEWDILVLNSEGNCNIWAELLENKREILSSFDEIVVSDNSLVGPFFNIQQIMDRMTKAKCQSWSVFKTKLSESGFACFNQKEKNIDEMIQMAKNDAEPDEVYVKESKYIGEWLFTDDPINELIFDFIILHAPFVKKKSLCHLRENEKVLYEAFIEALKQMD